MEDEEKSKEDYFPVLDEEEEEEPLIQIRILNNQLIFKIISKNNDNNLYLNNYISRNSFDALKQKNKIFSSYQSLSEIKNFIYDLTKNEDIKLERENNKYILTIATSSEIQEELKFDLIPEEKNDLKELKDAINQLLSDKQKKEGENKKIQEQMKELKNEFNKEKNKLKSELSEIKEEMNVFFGEGKYFIVSAINENKCLDVTPNNGCWNLIINDFNGNYSQKFIIKTENGIEHFIYYSENKILDIDIKNKKGIENGDNLIITDNLQKGNSQKWFFGKKGDYIYIKLCAHDDKVIDVPYSNINNFTLINVYSYNGNANQLWKFIKAE